MANKSALNQVSDVENLRRAWRAINKRNAQSKGLDRVTIQNFKNALEQNLQQISADLRAKTYTFQQLRPHAMDKPGSSKKRPLLIATVRDRVVMKALALFISPGFRQFNLPCSFAYVENGGVDAAATGREVVGDEQVRHWTAHARTSSRTEESRARASPASTTSARRSSGAAG